MSTACRFIVPGKKIFKGNEMTITFLSVGNISIAEIDHIIFYRQIRNAWEGNSILYGNTAELMGVHTFELVINYE